MADIALEVGPGVDGIHADKLRHAFMHVAALYGHRGSPGHRAALRIKRDRCPELDAGDKLQWLDTARGRLPLVLDHGHERPDLLAEAAFWCTSAGERPDTRLDAFGRILFSDSIHARLGLDPLRPWATELLQAVHDEWRSEVPGLPSRPSPVESGGLAIVATHDLDFIPLRRLDSALRYAKNLVKAAVQFRSMSQTWAIVRSGARALRSRRDPISNINVCLEMEQRLGIESTWTVLCDRDDPRDGNYSLDNPLVEEALATIERHGDSIAVHGSWNSLEPPNRLQTEYERLRGLGYSPIGGRQHWLRGDHADLDRSLVCAGALYDSTFGWADQPGFRHGHATPYIPWNHRRQMPAYHIEIPLVLMDTALAARQRIGADWRLEASHVLDRVRESGVGGAAVLWHDTSLGGAQLPPGVGELFETLPARGDSWISAERAAALILPRFRDAGAFGLRDEGADRP